MSNIRGDTVAQAQTVGRHVRSSPRQKANPTKDGCRAEKGARVQTMYNLLRKLTGWHIDPSSLFGSSCNTWRWRIGVTNAASLRARNPRISHEPPLGRPKLPDAICPDRRRHDRTEPPHLSLMRRALDIPHQHLQPWGRPHHLQPWGRRLHAARVEVHAAQKVRWWWEAQQPPRGSSRGPAAVLRRGRGASERGCSLRSPHVVVLLRGHGRGLRPEALASST